MTVRALAVIFVAASSAIALADDWPQWNGPTRDGRLREANVRTVIPQDGLELLWRKPVGLGYSGPAVADGRTYVMDYKMKSGNITNNAGKRDELQGEERITCFDAKSGELLWVHGYDRPYALSYPSGPRATPTVFGGKVYMLGAEGDLTCLTADTGEVVWERHFTPGYGAKTPIWGHAASPLVYQDSLICMVGGEGSLVVSFDLATGKENWRTLSARDTGYCPPSIVKRGGVEQLIIWDPETLSSLNPNNGDVYWQFEVKPGYGMSVLPPLLDGNLLYTTGESSTSLMLELDSEKPSAKELWRGAPKDGVYLATCTAIFEDGHIYGADIKAGAVVCARASDGERLWQSSLPTTGTTRGRGPAHSSAFLIKNQDSYLILSETGDFISATMSVDGYKETGRFHAIEPTGFSMGRAYLWTYPAISGKRLYVRNDKEIICYSLAQ